MKWAYDELLGRDDQFDLGEDKIKEWKLKLFRQIFEFHYNNCPMYNRYCKLYNLVPNDIQNYDDLRKIQPIPSDAFRDLDEPLVSVPMSDIIFKSSTSSTTSDRPVWFHMDRPSLERTNLANKLSFIRLLGLKDGFVFFLTPKDSDTGLVRGMLAAVKNIGIPESNIGYLVQAGELVAEQALKEISQCETRPRHLYGPPFAYMRLVEYMEANNKSVRLDPETRLLTTGGWKRVKGEVPREMFIERTSKAFGISGAQTRDNLGLTDIFTMLPECEHHKKHVPLWFHVSVRNPENTTEEVPGGETGLLVFMSALIQSYPAFCMTGDMGTVKEGVCECGRAGQVVQHMGRAQGAGARGCALRLEAFMSKIQK